MAEVKIRDLDAAVVKQLDQLAREKKMSRESFLRQFLTSIAALEESNHLIGKQEEAFQKIDNRNHRINERCSTIINRNS